MATCPKCGKYIKRRKGKAKCNRCGPLPSYRREGYVRNIKLNPDHYYPIREDLFGALERYLNHGIMPGSFLTAVLENNLAAACGRADHMNGPNLQNIVGYIYNHLPSNSWGSPEKVGNYLESLRANDDCAVCGEDHENASPLACATGDGV